MELKTYFAQDKEGRVLPGASVFLYQSGTTTLVSDVHDKDGNVLPNPFEADGDGLIQLATEDGKYDLRVSKGGLDYTMRVQFLDSAQAVETVVASADRAESEADRAEQAVIDGTQEAQQLATTQANRSESEADRAEAARDAAQLSAGVYADTATGLSATTDGDYFSVPSTQGGEFLVLYRNTAGQAEAVEVYPSASGVAQQVEAGKATSRLALPNADFRLSAPSLVTVDAKKNIISATDAQGYLSGVRRGTGRPVRYPFTSYGDRFQLARVSRDNGIIDGYSQRNILGRIIAYPYRSFSDPFVLAKVDAYDNIVEARKDSPDLPDQLGRMYVDLDVDAGDLWMTWRHGHDQMLRVRYMRNGFNELFNWRSTEIADLGDPRTASWTLIQSTNSDSWPPLIFSVDTNGDGGSSIYTGGNHGSDGGSGGENTAYMSAIAFTVDGRTLRPGESFIGFADHVQVYWRNEIMAYNTITLGRYPLSQEIRATFSPGDVSGFVGITAHEKLTIGLDNGPQMFSNGYNTFHYYDGEQQATLPIPTDGSTNTSGLFRDFPAWAAVFSHPDYGFHGAWLDRTFEAGDGRHISGSAGAFRKGSGLKFYSMVVGTGDLSMAAGDSYEWHGGYFWSPASMADGLDSAFTFHRRGLPHLGHAHVASGSGRISLPAWAAGHEVVGVGTEGIKGIPVSASGYSTTFNEIKR